MTVFLRQLSVQLSGLLNDFVGLPVARLRICSILKLPSWRQAQPLIAGFALALFAIGPALADGYKLGPQDKLRLRVYEWRAPVDQIFEWTPLNGDFVISSSGTVFLPMIGEIVAAGRTTSELADAIAQQMVDQIKLRWPPKVGVEVFEYRPFYIVGAVAKPGAYPYQPGLTVLRALSVAGGLPRPQDDNPLRLGREVIAGRGTVKQLALRTNQLLATKSRLQAEQKQADQITFPEELMKLKSDPELGRILDQEQSIFTARRTALTAQIATLKQLRAYLVSQVKSLQDQVKLKAGELSIVQKELGNVSSLVEKGLSVSSREFGLERLKAELSSEQLRLETEGLRAQQEISRTDVAIDEAQNNRAIEVATLLRTTEADLDDATTRYKTEQKLLYDSEVVYPRLLTARQQKTQADEPKYTLVRVADGKQQEIAADELTEVLPGDTLKVELPMPDTLSTILVPPQEVVR